ncbi:CPBP family intramembrane metalloprotease [Spirosoma sp. HMF4905]|uniref:CPBP family intramembrane metalloprotease n=1 Tax=Spirosoma arboris TaxID=2682092 RepID=A0A7K1SJI9_9BACT|nr:CPBP family intramembrane glutamic endopeptidase [Spirosoma arboris]MVM33746.1 CPBP family intramembrane metalloprotease [Spirosoma arboris]
MINRKVLVYLLITFTWTWTNWFIGLQYIAKELNQVTTDQFVRCFFLGVYGPALGAILTTAYFGGVQGTIALLKKLIIWKAPLTIYAVIVLAPILVLGMGIALYAWFVGPVGPVDTHAFAVIPNLLLASLVAGPLGEELGWRGLLLPELQTKFSALKSSLLIGISWYGWHLPLFFAPFGTLVSGQPLRLIPLVIYLAFVICLSCVYTWLVNNSNGSVLIAILIHLSINAGIALLFFPALKEGAKTCYFLATLPLILITLYLSKRTGFTATLSSD